MDCKPRDSLERSGKGSLEKGRRGRGPGLKRNLQEKLPQLSKDRAGSSVVVKRPHSDSSTPPLEKTANKKPRNAQVQTGMYKEAVAGIKMAIIHGSDSGRHDSG